VVGAQLISHLEGFLRGVDGYDVGGGEVLEQLDGDVPQSARAEHYYRIADA